MKKVKQMEMDGLFEGGEQTTLSGAGLGRWFSNYGMEKLNTGSVLKL